MKIKESVNIFLSDKYLLIVYIFFLFTTYCFTDIIIGMFALAGIQRFPQIETAVHLLTFLCYALFICILQIIFLSADLKKKRDLLILLGSNETTLHKSFIISIILTIIFTVLGGYVSRTFVMDKSFTPIILCVLFIFIFFKIFNTIYIIKNKVLMIIMNLAGKLSVTLTFFYAFKWTKLIKRNYELQLAFVDGSIPYSDLTESFNAINSINYFLNFIKNNQYIIILLVCILLFLFLKFIDKTPLTFEQLSKENAIGGKNEIKTNN